MFSDFFFFPSSAFFNSLGQDVIHPNLPPAKIVDTIELLNIKLDCRHFHVNMDLVPIVTQ